MLTSFIQNKKNLIFKKSTLYRKFIRKRTKESVGGGLKKFKRKLINLLRKRNLLENLHWHALRNLMKNVREIITINN